MRQAHFILRPAAALLCGLSFMSMAHAGMVTDQHGNVGYDTLAECDAAVQNGTAKFYAPVQKMKPLRQKGEVSVKTMTIADLGPQYKLGACDLGVNRANGRNGVAKPLQGKYVPYSPNMPLNAYMDKNGQVVRVSMKDCDNRFSAAMPRPVAIPAPAPAPVPAPVVVAPPAPVVAPAPAPVVAAAPVIIPPAPRSCFYAFGTVGNLRDKRNADTDDQVAAQLGAGCQFTPLLGAEVFAQKANQHVYEHSINGQRCLENETIGARLTVGSEVAKDLRVFGKVGVASVKHTGDYKKVYENRETRPTAGVGIKYDINQALSVRGDLDHFFKRSSDDIVQHKAATYVGVGMQYNF